VSTDTAAIRNEEVGYVQPPGLQDVPDSALVTQVLNGDHGAFELLVRRHQDALFRRARWMGLDADTAADMVQDTLVKAYRSLPSCRDASRFSYWVGRILRNRILDFLKNAERRGLPLPFSLPANSGNPELSEPERRFGINCKLRWPFCLTSNVKPFS
jgi:DNA-directed RNA polymerase specialized sigma24 family protein